MTNIIINADDFGITENCTEAICEAFRRNLITDTTMVVNCVAFDSALQKALKENLNGKIGLHFNLTEGKPLTDNICYCKRFVENGQYIGRIDRIKPLTVFEKKAVYNELREQANKFLSTGLTVTHADSHHHIHTALCVAPIFARVCREFGIDKVRLHRNIGDIPFYKRVVKCQYNCWLHSKGFQTTRYFGSMEDVERIGLLDNLEIMVHPDFDNNGNLIDRTDFENGYPVGNLLKSITDTGNALLKGYRSQ